MLRTLNAQRYNNFRYLAFLLILKLYSKKKDRHVHFLFCVILKRGKGYTWPDQKLNLLVSIDDVCVEGVVVDCAIEA